MNNEYANYYGEDIKTRLECPCGMSYWFPAVKEAGIGGRMLWSIDMKPPFTDGYTVCDGFGCGGCGRIVERRRTESSHLVIAMNGEPVVEGGLRG